jgi:acetolactate synthase I/II/III large subunit
MWTLSGAHIFPLLDAAVGGLDGYAESNGPLRLVDVRHEQTAAFAAEATGKLTRTPGFAVVTAGPGVTNTVSAVTSAHLSGSPMVLIGGRAPEERWGSGALQELDHPPIFTSITKSSTTIASTKEIHHAIDDAFHLASTPHRGPVFADVPMDVLFDEADLPQGSRERGTPTPRLAGDVEKVVGALHRAKRPLLFIGSDVWSGGAEVSAAAFVEEAKIPVLANGMARGVVHPDSPYLATSARSYAMKEADLILVVGAPLDFRLAYGAFNGDVVHVMDAESEIAAHLQLFASISGDLNEFFSFMRNNSLPDWSEWSTEVGERHRAGRERDQALLATGGSRIHPARIYGELLRRLDDDAVLIGDGGDFVSFAGRFVEPKKPGCWLDPGAYGCLGTGLGYAMAARIARPNSQVVLMLGDGAAGFSLMDVDTLVRHDLPVVMIVGNNGMWGLEKAPMQSLFGYDVAAELQSATRYDSVVTALGGAGELITDPDDLSLAIKRGFDSDVPYLINVLTDPEAAYPRSTTGI